MNQDMLISLDDDSLDQVNGGLFCVNPCEIVAGAVGLVHDTVEAGLEVVGCVLSKLPSVELNLKVGGGC